jgi:hypothetical protein
MKKTAAFILTVVMLGMAALLGACGKTGANTDISGTVPSPSATDNGEAQPAEPTAGEPGPEDIAPAEASPAETAGESQAPAEPFDFKEQTYAKDNISIKYPQIVGLSDTALQDTLNGIISDAALQGLEEMESGTEYEAAYTVSLNTPDVISIYFDSYYYVPGAAHPGLLLGGVIIDVPLKKAVLLNDLVTLDSAFAELLRKGEYSSMNYEMTDEIRSSIEDYLAETDDEFLLNELMNSGTSVWSSGTYLTPDALVVSVSVAHVLGDHIEISIGYDELAPFKTDNPVWDTVG